MLLIVYNKILAWMEWWRVLKFLSLRWKIVWIKKRLLQNKWLMKYWVNINHWKIKVKRSLRKNKWIGTTFKRVLNPQGKKREKFLINSHYKKWIEWWCKYQFSKLDLNCNKTNIQLYIRDLSIYKRRLRWKWKRWNHLKIFFHLVRRRKYKLRINRN